MSQPINDGGPAFPLSVNATDRSGEDFGVVESKGMLLRDYFAAKAVQGLMVRAWEDPQTGKVPDDIFDRWASAAYRTADAMLAARKNGGAA